MKVGQQALNDPKSVPRANGQVRLPFPWADGFLPILRGGFQHPGGGGSNGKDPAAPFFAVDDLLRHNHGDLAPFRFDFVCGGIALDGLKGSRSHMEGDPGHIDAHLANAIQKFLGEMQTRGGCGDRSGRACPERLITLAIPRFFTAGANVRGQW